jgi:hypothetical protein
MKAAARLREAERARSLRCRGIAAVAEGVETADTAVALQCYGCDAVQGHYYSPPLSATELLQPFGSPPHIWLSGTRWRVPRNSESAAHIRSITMLFNRYLDAPVPPVAEFTSARLSID